MQSRKMTLADRTSSDDEAVDFFCNLASTLGLPSEGFVKDSQGTDIYLDAPVQDPSLLHHKYLAVYQELLKTQLELVKTKAELTKTKKELKKVEKSYMDELNEVNNNLKMTESYLHETEQELLDAKVELNKSRYDYSIMCRELKNARVVVQELNRG